MPATLLTNATLPGGDVTDVLIGDDGTVAEVGRIEIDASDTAVTDLAGWLLLPAAVEPHAHLDKAFLAETVANPTGDLLGAIRAMEASRHLLDVADIVTRAERAARLLAANGYTAVRTHADVTLDHGLRSVEALVEVRRRVADVIDVEVVALSGWPVTGHAGSDQRELLKEALDAGADLVGGCPHLEAVNGEGTTAILSATEVLLAIADEHGVGVDLHTDETLDPDVEGLALLAELVLAGFRHPVTASHCVSLGMQSEDRQRDTAERVAEARISVVVLPHTNLFLQGRGHVPMPRGLTAVDALRAARVNVAAGADNLQDPFNPVGRACPFETAGLTIIAAHLVPDDAWAAVSHASRRALGLAAAGPVAGARADLLAVPAATVREAIAFGPPQRRVWRGGQELGEQTGNAELTDGAGTRPRDAT